MSQHIEPSGYRDQVVCGYWAETEREPARGIEERSQSHRTVGMSVQEGLDQPGDKLHMSYGE